MKNYTFFDGAAAVAGAVCGYLFGELDGLFIALLSTSFSDKNLKTGALLSGVIYGKIILVSTPRYPPAPVLISRISFLIFLSTSFSSSLYFTSSFSLSIIINLSFEIFLRMINSCLIFCSLSFGATQRVALCGYATSWPSPRSSQERNQRA